MNHVSTGQTSIYLMNYVSTGQTSIYLMNHVSTGQTSIYLMNHVSTGQTSIYLMNHVSTGTLTTVRMIHSGTYSSPVEISIQTGFSIFFKSTSTSLFTGSIFHQNLNNFHEYTIQHSLKSGGTKDHFKRVKVPGTAPYCKCNFGK